MCKQIKMRNGLALLFIKQFFMDYGKERLKMVIDFHTHAFPDKIAEKAISALAEKAKIPYYTNGTISDTDEKMKQWGVDKRVMLSIATNPKQQTNVNNFAFEANKRENIYAFGSVHPLAENALQELERIKEAGLLGIKLHPEYQEFYIDDESVYPIYEKCIELGLIVSFHAGKDLGYPGSLKASPKRILKLAKRFENAKFVLAHFGSSMMEKEVLDNVAGCGFYIDTAFSAGYIDKETAQNIIKKHGADKVLFASDCPWASSKETYDFINSFDLSKEDKDKIFYKNALELLKIDSVENMV